MQITWNTDVNAPCCPGEIIGDNGRSVLVQTDWDYPGVAGSFGWSLIQVQRCPDCGGIADGPVPNHGDLAHCPHCDHAWGEREEGPFCEHDGTDGTVDCPECGVSASQFIAAAGEWLRENDGVTVDDPGYFEG